VPPLAAFVEGWRRLLRAPAVLFGTWAVWWISWQLVRAALAATPGTAQIWTPGFDNPWLRTLYAQIERLAYALAQEAGPFFSPAGVPGPYASAIALQAGLWLFLGGGILDRLARGRPIRSAAFFSACGMYFVRFVRLEALLVVAGVLLWSVQRAFAASAGVRIGTLLVVGVAGVVVDFAKVRSVVEDRRSMIGALAAGLRFVRRRAGRVLLLVLINALAILAVARIQYQVISTPAPLWLVLVMSAGLLLLGIAVRLAFIASEVVFFQGELAHAGYTAAPVPAWPDSAAVEAIENLAASSRRHREDLER
jgi:hypothetical protein